MDDVIRGIGVGGMFVSGVAAGWLLLLGSLFEAEDPSGAVGNLLHAAGFVGFASALVAAYGLISGKRGRVAVAAIVQSLTAAALLCWWILSDFWAGADEPDAYFILPLVGVIAVDALVVVWAVALRPRTERS